MPLWGGMGRLCPTVLDECARWKKAFICLQRAEEAVVLGMMERSCSSSLSIHAGWVMLGHLLARLSSRMFFVD